jgi:hypothetical protein
MYLKYFLIGIRTIYEKHCTYNAFSLSEILLSTSIGKNLNDF